MKSLFTKHPHSLGESYFEHLANAMRFGGYMILGGLACITHAIFPFIFKKTASNFLFKMTHTYIERNSCTNEKVVSLIQCIQEKSKKECREFEL